MQITNLRTEQHYELHHRGARLHAHQTCRTDTHTAQSASPAFCLTLATSLRDTEIPSKQAAVPSAVAALQPLESDL